MLLILIMIKTKVARDLHKVFDLRPDSTRVTIYTETIFVDIIWESGKIKM